VHIAALSTLMSANLYSLITAAAAAAAAVLIT
jgi:hypothetical protein